MKIQLLRSRVVASFFVQVVSIFLDVLSTVPQVKIEGETAHCFLSEGLQYRNLSSLN
jgi:hypothetical protein